MFAFAFVISVVALAGFVVTVATASHAAATRAAA